MTNYLTPVLQNTGNFDAYLSYVNSQPILNEQQEKSLFEDYQQQNDLAAAQKLILSHLRFVAYIARSYKGYGLPIEDLLQEGTIGLMKSVKKFSLDFGVRLSSFAVHYIKSEIHEYVVRNWRLVKATTTKAKRKLFFNLRRLKAKSGWLTHQDQSEIAEQLGVSEQYVQEMEVQLSQPDIYLNSSTNHEEDTNSLNCEVLLEDKSSSFTSSIIQQDFNEKALVKIRKYISELDERSKDIVENRWLTEKKLPHKYFSEKYNVSQERIRQIEESAILKIKKKMAASDLQTSS